MLTQLFVPKQVYALDTVQERLDLAEEFGAVPIDGADQDNALKVIREGTEGRGVDCALEAVGAQPTIKLAFDLIRMGGAPLPLLSSSCITVTAKVVDSVSDLRAMPLARLNPES